MSELRVIAVAALLCLGCDEAASSRTFGLCNPERDPDVVVCDPDIPRRSSASAYRAGVDAVPDHARMIWLRNSVTDTMNPNGFDVSFRVSFHDAENGLFWVVEPVAGGLLSTSWGPAPASLDPCASGDPIPLLDSADLVPIAVRAYEERVGPLVIDESTRTAFRQAAPCLSHDGEVDTHFAIQTWSEELGFESWFFLFDPSGELTDVLGPCEDFSDPGPCVASEEP